MRFTIIIMAVLLAITTATAQDRATHPGENDVAPPDRLRTNRVTYSPVMEVIEKNRDNTSVSNEALTRLQEIQLEDIWRSLGDYRANYVRGFQSTQPGRRIAGRALTMRFLPRRPDLLTAIDTLAAEGDWDSRYYARAGEEARAGDVIVAELGGSDGGNFFGGMGALGIQLRGAAGVVIDGGSRDLAELVGETFADFPVFARFFDVRTTSTLGVAWLGVEWNTPVRVGSTTVIPGDIVVADESGVLFFPPELVATVLKAADEQATVEAYERELLRSGEYRFRDVYPLSPELRREYEQRR